MIANTIHLQILRIKKVARKILTTNYKKLITIKTNYLIE